MTDEQATLDTIHNFYLNAKNPTQVPGFADVKAAYDLIVSGSTDHQNIWSFAQLAQTTNHSRWGLFRALVEAWLLAKTTGQFPAP